MSLTVQASSQPSSRLRDQNLGELRNPHGSDWWVRYGSNNFGQNGGTNDDKGKDCNYLGSGDYSPEKAGVGGSTPSLATIIPKNLFELHGTASVRCRSASETRVKSLVRMSMTLKALFSSVFLLSPLSVRVCLAHD